MLLKWFLEECPHSRHRQGSVRQSGQTWCPLWSGYMNASDQPSHLRIINSGGVLFFNASAEYERRHHQQEEDGRLKCLCGTKRDFAHICHFLKHDYRLSGLYLIFFMLCYNCSWSSEDQSHWLWLSPNISGSTTKRLTHSIYCQISQQLLLYYDTIYCHTYHYVLYRCSWSPDDEPQGVSDDTMTFQLAYTDPVWYLKNLQDGLAWSFVQTLMVVRGWILLTSLIPWLFQHPLN